VQKKDVHITETLRNKPDRWRGVTQEAREILVEEGITANQLQICCTILIENKLQLPICALPAQRDGSISSERSKMC
jgi:hypothetical protein